MADAPKNIDELKIRLYAVFAEALERKKSSHVSPNSEAEFYKAALEAAKVIVMIETEQRRAKERGYNKLDKN